MKTITVKVKAGAKKKPAAVVRARLKAAHPKAHDVCDVEEVFPGETSGKRAGMVTVNLPDSVSDEDSAAIEKALQEDDDVEYAQRAAARRPR